ncbi:MAG: formate dehydrogenase [Candidatus Rokuibacteriota bacterium]
MNEQHGSERRPTRRTFLVGLVTGAGVAAALGTAVTRKVAASVPSEPAEPSLGPILYRRTAEAERYYRTLYYA